MTGRTQGALIISQCAQMLAMEISMNVKSTHLHSVAFCNLVGGIIVIFQKQYIVQRTRCHIEFFLPEKRVKKVTIRR